MDSSRIPESLLAIAPRGGVGRTSLVANAAKYLRHHGGGTGGGSGG